MSTAASASRPASRGRPSSGAHPAPSCGRPRARAATTTQRPDDAVGQDLDRAGRLQQRPVEREQPPEQVRRDAVAMPRRSAATPTLRAVSGVSNRLLLSRRSCRNRGSTPATVQVSQPDSSPARASTVAGALRSRRRGSQLVAPSGRRRPAGRRRGRRRSGCGRATASASRDRANAYDGSSACASCTHDRRPRRRRRPRPP